MVKNTQFSFSEKEMVLDYCKFLQNNSNCLFSVEVPFLHRSIDVVCKNSDNGAFYAVEFKIHDWRRALIQAKDYALGVENVFLCIPINKYTDKVKELIRHELVEAKCGLITYNPITKEFRQEIPSCSNIVWESTANAFRKGFEYSINNRNYDQLLSIDYE